MAKYELRIKARALRKEGKSIKKIAHQLEVSKSSVSMWVRDISLSEAFILQLKKQALVGAAIGRLKSLEIKKQNREKILQTAIENGSLLLQSITEREFLIAGLALYWGEGSKINRRVEFCNSDPKMIKFLVRWLEKYFFVKKEDFVCRVGINEIHKDREVQVKQYWSELTGIPLTQFIRTSFKHVKNAKVYDNFGKHFGVLAIGIRKSAKMHNELMGLLEGLYINMPR